MTETLRILTENTAKFAGGSVIKAKFYDTIIKQKHDIAEEDGESIVADIVKRAGLELV